ncbi:MAG: asparagine synthase (glutamine-hydrolyzing) [Candidatus Omnitrophota bacterium]
MCGICGIVNFDGRPVDKIMLQRMTNTLIHRGPDEEGYFYDQSNRISCGLGHRRLSIIDLNTGRQPIHNEDQTIWIVFNGEIYNFQELKINLLKQGHRFYTKTDTEVIIHLYEEYGTKLLKFLRGMFAFAIWDKKQPRLFLARDRLGKKPLNYYLDDKRIIFASEIKAISAADNVERRVDVEAMHYYLTYQYVPAPYTMFEGIKKILPAHYLLWDKNNLTIQRYWQVDFTHKQRSNKDRIGEELLNNLKEATKLRLISDVPLGVFLSGGMDSSAVVALMASLGVSEIKTFSIGFEEKEYDELRFARIVAERFNCEHHEFRVEPKIIEILPKLIWHYNEPFGDYSCIPTYCVAKMARDFVKVVLTGDGGDESFAGYLRYAIFKWTKFLDYLPQSLLKIISSLGNILGPSPEMRTNIWQIKRFLKFMTERGVRQYGNWMCGFETKEKAMLYHPDILADIETVDPLALIEDVYARSKANNPLAKIIATDLVTYLPNDLLVKMDIATMANSIEARSPFLDYQVVEFAATISGNEKLKGISGKLILKKIFKGILPDEIITRGKRGFGVPIGKWFRGNLKKYLLEVMNSSLLVKDNFLNQKFIDAIINKHLDGENDYGYKLWLLLNLELWYNQFIV